MERIHKNSLIIIAIIILVLFWFMHSNNEDFNEESPINCKQCSSCMPDFNDYMKKEECQWYKDSKANEDEGNDANGEYDGNCDEFPEEGCGENYEWNGCNCVLSEKFVDGDGECVVNCDEFPEEGCGENYEWNGCNCVLSEKIVDGDEPANPNY